VVAAIAGQWERPRVEMARVGIRERNNRDETQGAFGSVALGFGTFPHALSGDRKGGQTAQAAPAVQVWSAGGGVVGLSGWRAWTKDQDLGPRTGRARVGTST
jgi:hypothetical protein